MCVHTLNRIVNLQDERWVTPRAFGFYTFPPSKRIDGKYLAGAKTEWLEMMSFILDDIWWLCELPYHKYVRYRNENILLIIFKICESFNMF